MNRDSLKKMARERIEDSAVLLANHRWSAAYYLSGYSVGLALKACILKFIEQSGIIFVDKKFSEKCWTHRIEDLVRHADLEPERGQDIRENATRGGHWGVVESWSELSRYQQKTEAEARSLYTAITIEPDGVLPWIRQHW